MEYDKNSINLDKFAQINELLDHTIRYGVGGVLRALGALGFTFIFTRMFVPTQFGYYNLARSLIVFINLMLTEWIKQAINRYLPAAATEEEARRSKNTIVLYVYFLTLLFIVSNIIFWLLNYFYDLQFVELIFSSFVMVWTFSVYNICLQTLSAEIQSNQHTAAKITKSLGRLIFPLLLIFLFTKKIEFLILGEGLGLLVVIPYMCRRAELDYSIENLYRQISVIKTNLSKYLHYGLPMMVWFIAYILLSIGDRYIIQIYRGAAEVGIYSANYSLVTGGIEVVVGPLLLIAHPYLMKMWNNHTELETQNVITLITEWFIYGAAVCTGYLLFIAKPLTQILLGAEYRQGYIIIPIVSMGLFIWHLAMYGHKPLEFKERTKVMMYGGLGIALVNIILNFIFIPHFGYIAAAYTTLVSYVLYVVLVYYLTKRILAWIIPFKAVARKIIWVIVALLLTWFYLYKFNNIQYYLRYIIAAIIYSVIAIFVPLKQSKITIRQIWRVFKN